MKGLKAILTALGLAIGSSVTASHAEAAENFPNHAVTIIVPFPAGGGTDVIARSLGRALSAHWGQPVIIEDPSGADGLIGTRRVLKTPADGHTILFQVSPMLLWPSTMPTAKINILRDFRLITKVQSSPLTVSTSTPFPGNTTAEFLAWCKTANSPCTVGAATTFGQPKLDDLGQSADISPSPKICPPRRFSEFHSMKYPVIGFEWTTNRVNWPGQPRDIVQMGACRFDVDTEEIAHARHVLVRPTVACVSNYCAELTGIDPMAIAHGISFVDACAWLNAEYGAASTWASFGHMDCVRLRQQCEREGVAVSLSNRHWCSTVL